MRLRQIAFAARELAPAEHVLGDVLGLGCAYRDPGVAVFGLENGVIPVGSNFLEILAPVRDGTACARFLDRKGGDAGYMVILQAADGMLARSRAEESGVRVIVRHDDESCTASQFHPVDVGGVILGVDAFIEAPDPQDEHCHWRWAGPDWQHRVQAGLTAAMTGVELVSADPATQAATWSSLLDEPVIAVEGGVDMPLSGGGTVRFRTAASDKHSGIRAVDLRMNDKTEALRRARRHALSCGDGFFDLMQVRFNLAA